MNTDQDVQFEERWRRRFERYAYANDDDAGIAGWSEGGLAARLRQFLRLWEAARRRSPAGRRWLDAGCGAGTYARYLAGQALQVTAVDYSEPTTHKARSRSPGEIDWAVADATRLPFASGCLDGVLCFGVMQALSGPQQALAEMRRVLRPGGEVWVDALNAHCLPSALAEARRVRRGAPPHLRYDRARDFANALRNAGFSDVRIHWVPVMPSRLRRLQSMVESAPVRLLLRLPLLGEALSHSMLAVGRVPYAAGKAAP